MSGLSPSSRRSGHSSLTRRASFTADASSFRQGGTEPAELTRAGEQRLCVLILGGESFSSVNAKVLAHGHKSSRWPFKPGVVGASPTTDAICPRSSVRPERHRAKVEVAGAIPAVDANLPLCLSSRRASFVNSYSSVRVRPGVPAFACRLRHGRLAFGCLAPARQAIRIVV